MTDPVERRLVTRRRLLEGQERLRNVERQRFLERLDPQPTDRIFDIGCSTGRLIDILKSLGIAQAMGSDNGEDIPERPDILHLGAEDLHGVPDSSFNKVVMGHILEHLSPVQRSRALREAARILQAEGELHISFFLYDDDTIRSPAVTSTMDHPRIVTREELCADIIAEGFQLPPENVEVVEKLTSLVRQESVLPSLLMKAIKASA